MGGVNYFAKWKDKVLRVIIEYNGMWEMDALFESGLSELAVSGKCIHHSAMYFSLGDNRKYFTAESLYGTSSWLLKGGLSYYFISEEFYCAVSEILTGRNISKIHFVPSTLAQASYLISEKEREGYAFLLDIGFLKKKNLNFVCYKVEKTFVIFHELVYTLLCIIMKL